MVQSTSFSFFLYEITFFLAFGQAEILAVLFKYCFVTKRSLNYITHRKTFQNKKRVYFNKMYFYHVLFCKGMVKPVSGKPPPPPKTSPPWGVRGRVSVRLGIALGLGPGGLFPGGIFPRTGKTLLHQRCSRSRKKHLLPDVLQSSCSWKFCKTHRKTPVLESLFNKVAGIKRVHHVCFPMKCFF